LTFGAIRLTSQRVTRLEKGSAFARRVIEARIGQMLGPAKIGSHHSVTTGRKLREVMDAEIDISDVIEIVGYDEMSEKKSNVLPCRAHTQ
jgi:hypothetical protein